MTALIGLSTSSLRKQYYQVFYACHVLLVPLTIIMALYIILLFGGGVGHFLLTIPSISRLDTHPFTAASICDEQSSTAAGRALVFYIRAKEGWTKDLWNHVFALLSRGETHVASEKVPFSEQVPSNGVLLRTLVDGPFGSSIRTQWRQYSTVLVVVGGSGVSFGVSVLQFLALCLAGRDGKYLGGHSGAGVRRTLRPLHETAHVQWCASILQHCMTMMPAPSLDVDIFVTNPTTSLPKEVPTIGDIELPNIVFEDASEGGHHPDETGRKRDSVGSVDSDYHQDDYIDPNPDITTYGDEGSTESGNTVLCEIYTLYLTNFEGDQDVRLPGEAALNKSIRKSGKMRRAKSRLAKEGNGELVKPMPSTSKGAITQFQASSPGGLLSPTWRTANQTAESLKDTAYQPLSSRPTSPRHSPDPRLQQASPSPSNVFDGDSEAPPGAFKSWLTLERCTIYQSCPNTLDWASRSWIVYLPTKSDGSRTCHRSYLRPGLTECHGSEGNCETNRSAKIRGGDMSGFIDLVSEEFDF
ncbi:ferric reductase transmembrane component precursor [Salix suchowensis]|nr:ferric reductase transmembrane component precursor [Salix suchowensis]